MSNADEIIAEIERDPGRFDEYSGELRTILESGAVDARRSVAQLLGDVAEVDPEIGIRHPELLELAFEDENNIVRGLAVHAVAAITQTSPKAATDFVSQIATTIADEKLVGSAQMDGIAALGKIDRETAMSVSEADEVLASLLHETDAHVRETVAINLDDTVKASPRSFQP